MRFQALMSGERRELMRRTTGLAYPAAHPTMPYAASYFWSATSSDGYVNTGAQALDRRAGLSPSLQFSGRRKTALIGRCGLRPFRAIHRLAHCPRRGCSQPGWSQSLLDQGVSYRGTRHRKRNAREPRCRPQAPILWRLGAGIIENGTRASARLRPLVQFWRAPLR